MNSRIQRSRKWFIIATMKTGMGFTDCCGNKQSEAIALAEESYGFPWKTLYKGGWRAVRCTVSIDAKGEWQ